MAQPILLPPPPIKSYFLPPEQEKTTPGISFAWLKWLQQLFNNVSIQPAVLQGSHASRISGNAGDYPAGSTFYETDTGITYIDNGIEWVYLSGIQQATQSTLPSGLGIGDTGLLVNVTDFRHILQWSGTFWEWGPGESGSGQIASFLADPGTGWHLCDGGSVSRLNPDGTVSAVTLPNYTASAYLKLGIAASAGPNAASGATTAVSAGTPSGTNSAPTFTGNSRFTSIEDVDVDVQSGTGTTVAGQGHTHTVTATGTVSAPTFTGTALSAHSHGAGSLELRNSVLAAYFRI